MIRIMVVDDESLAREQLIGLIRTDPDLRVVSQANNGLEAMRLLTADPVDVVFLDIQMPGLSGLEMATYLAVWKDPPLVVFATAYDEYAVKAFETHAIDYILKPYDATRLAKTFVKLKEHIRLKMSSRQKLQSFGEELLKTGAVKMITGRKRNSKDRMVIDPSEVFFFQAQMAEVTAHLEGQTLIVYKTLEELTQMLDPAKFVQPHRSYIVNLAKVEKVVPLFKENYELVLKDSGHTHIPLSRHRSAEIKKRLSNW